MFQVIAILVGKREETRKLWTSKVLKENAIKFNLKEMGRMNVEWVTTWSSGGLIRTLY
jgi:hypothetical protein